LLGRHPGRDHVGVPDAELVAERLAGDVGNPMTFRVVVAEHDDDQALLATSEIALLQVVPGVH
jgi:hypothetical protein